MNPAIHPALVSITPFMREYALKRFTPEQSALDPRLKDALIEAYFSLGAPQSELTAVFRVEDWNFTVSITDLWTTDWKEALAGYKSIRDAGAECWIKIEVDYESNPRMCADSILRSFTDQTRYRANSLLGIRTCIDCNEPLADGEQGYCADCMSQWTDMAGIAVEEDPAYAM